MSRQNEDYCNDMGHDIEQLDSSEFIDEYLVDEQFDIYTKGGSLWIDFISGVNHYGEVLTSIEIHSDNTFRVEHCGTSVGTFRSDDLYDGLTDALCDMIERR